MIFGLGVVVVSVGAGVVRGLATVRLVHASENIELEIINFRQCKRLAEGLKMSQNYSKQ